MASNAQQLYSDLQHLGLSQGAAIGVVGNFVAESGVNPKSVQKNGPGRSLAQWSVGGRWDQLLAWAKGKGADPLTFATQEAFAVQEMQSMGVWSKLLATTNANDAAALVMRQYEMPADQSDANAVRRAQAGVKAINDGGGFSPSDLLPWNGIPKLLDGAGSAVGGAVSGAAGAVGSAAVSAARPLVIEGVVAVLGLSLVGIGVVTLARGGTKKAESKLIEGLT